MKKYMKLVSASMLFAMMTLFFSCSEAKDSSDDADNPYGCNPCNFEVNYDELDEGRVGNFLAYHKKGVEIEGELVRHGPEMTWWDDECPKWHTCGCNKDGHRDGKWTFWYENGNVMKIQHYKAGDPVGVWLQYDEEGELIGSYDYGGESNENSNESH